MHRAAGPRRREPEEEAEPEKKLCDLRKGDLVYFCAGSEWVGDKGDRLEYGARGEVRQKSREREERQLGRLACAGLLHTRTSGTSSPRR